MLKTDIKNTDRTPIKDKDVSKPHSRSPSAAPRGPIPPGSRRSSTSPTPSRSVTRAASAVQQLAAEGSSKQQGSQTKGGGELGRIDSTPVSQRGERRAEGEEVEKSLRSEPEAREAPSESRSSLQKPLERVNKLDLAGYVDSIVDAQEAVNTREIPFWLKQLKPRYFP